MFVLFDFCKGARRALHVAAEALRREERGQVLLGRAQAVNGDDAAPARRNVLRACPPVREALQHAHALAGHDGHLILERRHERPADDLDAREVRRCLRVDRLARPCILARTSVIAERVRRAVVAVAPGKVLRRSRVVGRVALTVGARSGLLMWRDVAEALVGGRRGEVPEVGGAEGPHGHRTRQAVAARAHRGALGECDARAVFAGRIVRVRLGAVPARAVWAADGGPRGGGCEGRESGCEDHGSIEMACPDGLCETRHLPTHGWNRDLKRGRGSVCS